MQRSPHALITILILAIAVAGGVFLSYAQKSEGIIKDKGENMSDISAVFVNGGGIYFGKITQMDREKMVLEEVYNYGVVPSEGVVQTENSETKPTLFDASKVGIAPSSQYNLNMDQVILWYSLKNDSDVVKTIEQYKQSQ